MPSDNSLLPMLEKLSLWRSLGTPERKALLAMPHDIRTLKAHDFIVREGDRSAHCCLLLSGYAIRHKIAGNGKRQIFSIYFRGDVIDLHNAVLFRADHNVQVLTEAKVAIIPVTAIREIIETYPSISLAMWHESLVEDSIFREWTLNVGCRDATTRTAHLLCEMAIRLKTAGLGEILSYQLPMTQEQLGDALSLTSVHINRMLQSLIKNGYIRKVDRHIEIIDFDRMSHISDFDTGYLHLSAALELA